MPVFPATRVGSINRALVRAGCLTLTGSETSHPSGPAILLLYDTVLASLAGYPWQHFKSFAKLQRSDAEPEAQWTNKFTPPADRLDLPFAYFDRSDCRFPFMVFEHRNNFIYTDAMQLWCRYARIVEPGLWPGYFMDLFTLNLAAEYALAIREDAQLRKEILRECFGPPEMHGQGGRYAYATSLDSQKATAEQAGNGSDPLTSLYRSGG